MLWSFRFGKIGDSDPAPRFEVVSAPNQVVQAVKESESSPTKQLQLEFWTAVRDALQKTGKFASLKSARGRNWFDIAIGSSQMTLSLLANTWDKKVGVLVYLRSQAAETVLAALAPQRADIEAALGEPLEWNPHPEKQDKMIRLLRPADISIRSEWPQIISWLPQHAVAFKETFTPRLLAVNLSGESTTVDLGVGV